MKQGLVAQPGQQIVSIRRSEYGVQCVAASQPRRPTTESRRLRSKDDVAPDVRPTLGLGKKGALVRGDRGGARDTMTAQQKSIFCNCLQSKNK